MASLIAEDRIQTTLLGGNKFVPGITPALEEGIGKFTVIGGDGLIFVSNDSDAASPVKLTKKFSLSRRLLAATDGFYFDAKASLFGDVTRPWDQFKWFVGTKDSYVRIEDTKEYGLAEVSGGDRTVFNAEMGQPSGNFYQMWVQEVTYTKDWWDTVNAVWNGSPQERTVNLLRYMTISSTYPWAWTENQSFNDSLGLLSVGDFTTGAVDAENHEPYRYLGIEDESKTKMITRENVEFSLSAYVSQPTPVEDWEEWPFYGPASDINGFMSFLTYPEDNGHIHRYHKNGTTLGGGNENTPITFAFFDTAAANAHTYLSPTSTARLTGEFSESYGGPDGGWGNSFEVERTVGYLSYYREPYIRESYEGVFIGQSEISYKANSYDLYNEAWEGLTTVTAYAGAVEGTGGILVGEPIANSGRKSGGDYRDDWGYFDPEGTISFSGIPWTGQSVSVGQTVTVDPAWLASIKFQVDTGEPVRVAATIYREWPVERVASTGTDTYEYLFDEYDNETSVKILTGTGTTNTTEVDCRTAGRHPVCFQTRDIIAPDVVQGSFSVTIDSAEVYRNNQWQNLSGSEGFYLFIQYRGGDLFRYGGWVREEEEGVFPDNYDITVLYPGTRLERIVRAYYDQVNIGKKAYLLDEVFYNSGFQAESTDQIYYDNLRADVQWIKRLASFWGAYEITVSGGTTADLPGGQEQIAFNIGGIHPQIDEIIGDYQSVIYAYSDPSSMWESEVYPNYYDRHSWSISSNPNIYSRGFSIVDHDWKVNPITPT